MACTWPACGLHGVQGGLPELATAADHNGHSVLMVALACGAEGAVRTLMAAGVSPTAWLRASGQQGETMQRLPCVQHAGHTQRMSFT